MPELVPLIWLAIAPEITIEPPWELVEESGSVLRFAAGTDRVEVDLGSTAGVTPLLGDHALRTPGGLPLLRVPWPELGLSKAEITSEGPDLVVRLYGPPLHTVSPHPSAPPTPVHTWIRVRPRGETWRFGVRGLVVVHVSGQDITAGVASRGLEVRSDEWGGFTWQTDAPHTSSAMGPTWWTLSLVPALYALKPYPELGITWERPGTWRLNP